MFRDLAERQVLPILSGSSDPPSGGWCEQPSAATVPRDGSDRIRKQSSTYQCGHAVAPRRHVRGPRGGHRASDTDHTRHAHAGSGCRVSPGASGCGPHPVGSAAHQRSCCWHSCCSPSSRRLPPTCAVAPQHRCRRSRRRNLLPSRSSTATSLTPMLWPRPSSCGQGRSLRRCAVATSPTSRTLVGSSPMWQEARNLRRTPAPHCARSVKISHATRVSSTQLAANTRLGIRVGSAYLKAASRLMREEMLPATPLYRQTPPAASTTTTARARRVDCHGGCVVGGRDAGLLVLVQVYVRRRSNRILNRRPRRRERCRLRRHGRDAVQFTDAHSTLNRAQSDGSDSVEVLTSARSSPCSPRATKPRAREHGSGDVYLARFDRVMSDLGGSDGTGGLLAVRCRGVADRTGDGDRVQRPGASVQRAHDAAFPGARARRPRRIQPCRRPLRRDHQQGGEGCPRRIRRYTPGARRGRPARSRAADAHNHAESATPRRGQRTRELGSALSKSRFRSSPSWPGLLVLLGLERRIAEYR